MKKLLLFAFFLLLFSKNIEAQEKMPANRLSVVYAPNTFNQLAGRILDDASHTPGTGYTIGLDFARNFSKSWHYTLGVRYNAWNSTTETGPLMWPSEYSTGQYVYDPTLPHFVAVKNADKAWQLLAGAGWHSAPKKWRWNANIEAGATDFTKKTTGGSNVIRLTVGANAGPEWCLNRQFHLFLQPGGRFVFNDIGSQSSYKGNKFLSLELETGVRYAF